jgi:hypothetical protein
MLSVIASYCGIYNPSPSKLFGSSLATFDTTLVPNKTYGMLILDCNNYVRTTIILEVLSKKVVTIIIFDSFRRPNAAMYNNDQKVLVVTQINSDEQNARTFFVLGIVFWIFHLVAMIKYCGSSDPAVKRWANYSAIAFVIQVTASALFFCVFPLAAERSG